MAQKIIQALEQSILRASSDYCKWSQGKCLWHSGVESMLEIYTASALYKIFQGGAASFIDLQYKTSDLPFPIADPEFRPGRIDLYVDSRPSEGLAFIEFKRYMDHSNVRKDIERLVIMTKAAKAEGIESLGYVAGPVYLDQGQAKLFEWNSAELAQKCPRHLFTLRIGAEEALPCQVKNNKNGQLDRHFAVILEIAAV